MCVCFLNFVASFIEDLLAVNMNSNGVLKLAKQPFSPTQTIIFVIDLFKPHLRYKNISLRYKFVNDIGHLHEDKSLEIRTDLLGECRSRSRHLTNSLPESLLGDERRLKQVLINLVKNALKFTSEGHIEILATYS